MNRIHVILALGFIAFGLSWCSTHFRPTLWNGLWACLSWSSALSGLSVASPSRPLSLRAGTADCPFDILSASSSGSQGGSSFGGKGRLGVYDAADQSRGRVEAVAND